MTTALQQAPENKPQVVAGTSLIQAMAARYGLEPTKFLNTLIKTVFPSDKQNASHEQVAAFLTVAKRYELDPFIKEIYAFPARSGGIVPIVSVDGWSTLINRQPTLDGIDFEFHFDDQQNLLACTTTIYRKDRAHPTRITEYMRECARNTDPWRSHPARMLRHKSLIQCARLAFGLAGIYDPDEAERIVEAEQGVVQVNEQPQPSKTERMAAQLQNHPAVIDEPVEAEPAKPLSAAEIKAEEKRLRKLITEKYDERVIDRHTGNRDINALKHDELVTLHDALVEEDTQ